MVPMPKFTCMSSLSFKRYNLISYNLNDKFIFYLISFYDLLVS